MLNTTDIDLLIALVQASFLKRQLNAKEYNTIVDSLRDMRDDAAYTEECQRENELEASATYNCLSLPQWCGKCYVCKAYGVKEGPGTE